MSKIRLLFVDDEREYLEQIEILFGLYEKFEVHTLNNPELAIHKAAILKPDIIFLDVSMPEMDGGELAVSLRENPVTQDIPIVFLTAIISQTEKGLHGGQLFLPKPASIEEILNVCQDLINDGE